MSSLHPIQLSALSEIIYNDLLKEAEQSRRAAAMTATKRRWWRFHLGGLFKFWESIVTQPVQRRLPKSE